jgi:hypothetical protein
LSKPQAGASVKARRSAPVPTTGVEALLSALVVVVAAPGEAAPATALAAGVPPSPPPPQAARMQDRLAASMARFTFDFFMITPQDSSVRWQNGSRSRVVRRRSIKRVRMKHVRAR